MIPCYRPIFTLPRLLLVITFFCVHSAYSQAADGRELGTNLTEVTDYTRQLPFLDIFRFSRTWITQCRSGIDPGCTPALAFDTGEASEIDLDTHGWVKSIPSPSAPPLFTSVATFWDVPLEFPAGPYVVLYEGEGTIEYELGASKDMTASSPGRDIVQVTPQNGGILLRIASTNPANYIRNIRMTEVSNEASLSTQTFRMGFLDRLQPYKALRYMDWMRTNNSVVVSWGARAKPDDARYSTEKGVPAEVMIELSNTALKAPWFTMPHQATDSYITSFATLTKNLLSPVLPIYVEYSNEAWNSVFSQGAFIEQQGQLEWPGSPESGFTKRINWYGKRAAEVCDLWKQAFSNTPSRVICVIASQAANSWTAEEALLCPLWNAGPCVSHGISALAIAPYFGDYIGQEEAQSEVLAWTSQSDGGLATLFAEIESGGKLAGGPNGGAVLQSLGWIQENKLVAESFDIALLAYEGGQHLVGVGSASNNAVLTDLFTSANRDPRLGITYSLYLSGWQSRGGELFMHFSDISEYSKFGSWGALEGVHHTSSPKFDALRAYASGGSYTPPAGTPTPEAGGERHLLAVRVRGTGSVSSSPAGLACSDTCSSSFQLGTRVKLRAKASRGASFSRWLGACRTSRRACIVDLSRDRRVTAVFKGRPRR
jgi:hypothetical protein